MKRIRSAYLRQVIMQAQAAGWVVTATEGGRTRFSHPNGALVFAPHNPSDPRGMRNLAATLRRKQKDPNAK